VPITPLCDPEFERLIATLKRSSLRKWWPKHDVLRRLSSQKRIQHKTGGRIVFEYTSFAVTGAGVLPSPRLPPSTASTSSAAKKAKIVQPMCPVRNVSNVSGRSTIIDALVPQLKRSDQPPQDPFR
jgi:hypothetical protein